MWFVMVDDDVASEFASPVAARMYAEDLRRRGKDATVSYDEGGR